MGEARKIKKYQQLIVELLESHQSSYNATNPELQDQLICDYQSKNFQLITTGWSNNKYHYIVNFHFQIKLDGKIWLMANNTDIRIAEELVEKGVPRMDIVLGFHQPQYRQFTNFAST